MKLRIVVMVGRFILALHWRAIRPFIRHGGCLPRAAGSSPPADRRAIHLRRDGELLALFRRRRRQRCRC